MKPVKPKVPFQAIRPAAEPTLNEILAALQPGSAASTTTSDSPATNAPSVLAALPSDHFCSLPVTCALCRVVHSSVLRQLKSLFAEFINDPASRLTLRSARGFCPLHTEIVGATGDSLGIAILYADLADQAIERWKSSTARASLFSTEKKRQQCPACTLKSEADARYVSALAAGLASEAVWNSLAEGDGLCVRHTELTAAATTTGHGARLRDLQSKKLELLIAELNEIIRKNDYRFRGEEWGAERDAWLRALNTLTRP